jgi:transposase
VGLDVSKLKISVAVAEGVRNGEVRFYGDIPCRPAAVAATIKKLARSVRSGQTLGGESPVGVGRYDAVGARVAGCW